MKKPKGTTDKKNINKKINTTPKLASANSPYVLKQAHRKELINPRMTPSLMK
jgi:hypothetical protein